MVLWFINLKKLNNNHLSGNKFSRTKKTRRFNKLANNLNTDYQQLCRHCLRYNHSILKTVIAAVGHLAKNFRIYFQQSK